MMRNEAIKIMKDREAGGGDWAGIWVDRLVALGVLKLEEPTLGERKYVYAANSDLLCVSLGWSLGGEEHFKLVNGLEQAKLKLEKVK